MLSARGLLLLLFTVSSVVIAQLKEPSFTKIFDAQFLLDRSIEPLVGPLGRRALAGFKGGNLTDPSTGDLVATVVPGLGGELGLFGTNSVFYPDVRLVLQFVDDGSYAFLEIHGIRSSTLASSFIRIETDSETHRNLTEKFLFSSLDVSKNPAVGAVYQLDESDSFVAVDKLLFQYS